MTYQYSITKTLNPQLTLQLNSNYTLDKEFVNELAVINNNIGLKISSVSILIQYTDTIKAASDCVEYKNIKYCLNHTNEVTGDQRLENSIIIANYFSYLSVNQGSLTDFLSYLQLLYQTCEFDYSTTCNRNVLNQSGGVLNSSTSVLQKYSIKTYNMYPIFVLNNLEFCGTDYIEMALCLSYYNVPAGCPMCSPGCSFLDLQGSVCNDGCNTTSCGYDNLACLKEDNCYSFMIGDNNCNKNCNNDTDCSSSTSSSGNSDNSSSNTSNVTTSDGTQSSGNSTNTTDVCAPGCLYSEMAKGNCPLSCKGSCFSKCSSDYCSPNCLFKDLAAGNCSASCSASCLGKCYSDTCAQGCTYSAMSSGLCPYQCSGSCFSNCSSAYCSPGCAYADLYSGLCPSICAKSCFTHCSSILYCSLGCLYSEINNTYCPSSCTSECCYQKSSKDSYLLLEILLPLSVSLTV